MRQKSNPQTQKINRQMLTNYPFFFTPEKPAKLSAKLSDLELPEPNIFKTIPIKTVENVPNLD